MAWNEGSFIEGAIAGALGGGAIGTAAAPGVGTIPGAVLGAIVGALIKSPLFVILGSVLIGIFIIGGATLFGGLPWWVLVVGVIVLIFKFTGGKK